MNTWHTKWRVPVDPKADGAEAFTIAIAGPNEPKSASRAERAATFARMGLNYTTAWKSIRHHTREEMADFICRLLRDGEPRTFHRICVELSGHSGETCIGESIAFGLRLAVQEGLLCSTATTPIYFRLTKGVDDIVRVGSPKVDSTLAHTSDTIDDPEDGEAPMVEVPEPKSEPNKEPDMTQTESVRLGTKTTKLIRGLLKRKKRDHLDLADGISFLTGMFYGRQIALDLDVAKRKARKATKAKEHTVAKEWLAQAERYEAEGVKLRKWLDTFKPVVDKPTKKASKKRATKKVGKTTKRKASKKTGKKTLTKTSKRASKKPNGKSTKRSAKKASKKATKVAPAAAVN